MFVIDDDFTIHLTRGDVATIEVKAKKDANEDYSFVNGDVVRFQVTEKGKCDEVVLQKDVEVEAESLSIDISLTSSNTRIGELISKPKEYWYSIELNPETKPQTIIGYDKNGPKVFRLYPEGDDK